MKASVIYSTYIDSLVEGVSKNVHHLRESLNERGIDALDESPRVDISRMNKRSVYVTQGIAAYRRVLAALRDPSVDVVHYHVSIPGMSAWAALAKTRARSNKPMILHMWNPWFEEKDTHVSGGRERSFHKLFNSPWTTMPFLPSFDQVVVSSEYQKRQLEMQGYLGEVRVITNGVDLDGYQPAPKPSTRVNARRELGLPVDSTLLVYYGHMTPWKGVRVLVDALPAAFADNPKARLVIARTSYGRDEQLMREQLRALGLLDRVTIMGVCDVPLLLQAADCGVVPATAAVGTACHPNVVLEYASAGLPIVASRVGSIPEAVVDGRTGLLASPGDAADLAANLHTLLSDDALRQRLGAAARVRAEKKFDWRSIAAQYAKTYEDVLGRGVDRNIAPHTPPVIAGRSQRKSF